MGGPLPGAILTHTPSETPSPTASSALRWLCLLPAVAVAALLAWRLTDGPAPAGPSTSARVDASSAERARDGDLAPPAASEGSAPAPQRRRGECRFPRQFDPSEEPWLISENDGERWYLRCPRHIRMADGAKATLVRYQDPQGRTGLGVRRMHSEDASTELRTVLELDDLSAVDAEVLGCAALEPSDSGRAWISVQRSDRSRVIHALRWQGDRLVLDGTEPALRASEDWMKDRLWEPALARHDDTLLMYLRCGSRTRADLCVASSREGDRWSLHPARVLTGIEAGKDEVYGAPWAFSDGERVHLWFSHKRYDTDGEGRVVDVGSEVHHVASTDPHSFELHYRSVVLSPGFADWAGALVDTPSVIRIQGQPALLFRGGSGAKEGTIGVAWGDCGAERSLEPSLLTKSVRSTRRAPGEEQD